MTNLSTIKKTVAALGLAAALFAAPAAQAQNFRGGGAMHSFSGCEEQGWSNTQFVRARMRLASDNNAEHSISLFLPSGGTVSVNFSYNFRPSNRFRRSTGYAVWEALGRWQPNPQTRLRLVEVIAPDGASLANATDLRLQFQIKNFNWMRGCRVTVDLAVART
ncbi:MAG: hypothetical protein KDJ98_05690 [Rhodobacteraceae bacterium]|nr:hypothetical protein [Paracoccaceae bacterium]